jgi:hypothetical protein
MAVLKDGADLHRERLAAGHIPAAFIGSQRKARLESLLAHHFSR